MEDEKFVSQKEHQEFVRRVEDEEARQNHRLTELEGTTKQIYELTASVRELALNVTSLTKEMGSQGTRLTELEKAPGKNWSAVQTAIITAMAAAIGSGIISAVLSFM